jgi:hypothetical protein
MVGYPDCDDPLDVFKDCITQASLGFGGYNFAWRGRDNVHEDDSYKDLRFSPMEAARKGGLVKWLSEPNRLQRLILGAPILYHQAWLLPLWAQGA